MLGIGVHLGAQHDVGNLSNQGGSFLYEPQNSMLMGFSFKANMSFLFFRTGCDVSMMINRNQGLDSTAVDGVEYASFSYLAVPGFIGIRYPLKNAGEFYMGAGVAYFIGTGEVKLVASAESEDVDAIALGYGFVTGIEFQLLPFLHLYMEWEYFDARSDPVMKSDAALAWKDLHIDFSGHRILVGAMYYLL
jgi:opacity protein-like surface antigen